VLEEVLKIECVDRGWRIREVRVDLKAVEVAHHEERWVVQGFAVLQELLVRGLQVLPLALVFPGEMAAFPDVRESVSTSRLAGALLESIGIACRVAVVRRGDADHAAEIDEVLLGGSPLGRCTARPLCSELCWSQGATHGRRGESKRPGCRHSRACFHS